MSNIIVYLNIHTYQKLGSEKNIFVGVIKSIELKVMVHKF